MTNTEARNAIAESLGMINSFNKLRETIQYLSLGQIISSIEILFNELSKRRREVQS